MNKLWFLYIARTRTGRYYTGISQSPKERIKAHNSGNGAKFAVNQGPFELVYVSLPIENKHKARELEIKVKDWSQEKKNRLITKEWELDIDS